MSKTWRAERLEKKPKRVEPKAPRKVRYEDFVESTLDEDIDEGDFGYPEQDDYDAPYRNFT